MLKSLRLRGFKSFRDASIDFGALTVLVGANASGKSNIRDAIRFLAGVGRGYSLLEILEGKWGEGGVAEWNGIRGGAAEVANHDGQEFSVACNLQIRSQEFGLWDHASPLKPDFQKIYGEYVFGLTAESKHEHPSPRLVDESLEMPTSGTEIYGRCVPQGKTRIQVEVSRGLDESVASHTLTVSRKSPILSQLAEIDSEEVAPLTRRLARAVAADMKSVQFLDLAPDAMREPSPPGQTVLGDRGENLSSVLEAVCEDEHARDAVLEWIRQLTPLDVTDLEFARDHRGYVLVMLVERGGSRTSAYSASDGTLRFLGMIAALFGPNPARLYFIEELDTGIHPARLALLLDLIESRVDSSRIQVVATTHAPQLLGLLSDTSREHAALVYRLEESHESRMIRIMDIPHVREALEDRNLSRLHESGWLENVMEFTSEQAS